MSEIDRLKEELRKLQESLEHRTPVAWMSVSGWITASKHVMEAAAKKGVVFEELYK